MYLTTALRPPRLHSTAIGLCGLLALAWGSIVVSAQRVDIKATVHEADQGSVQHNYHLHQQTLPQPQIQFGQQEVGNQADCPGADGHTYYTPNGVFFTIQCFRHHWTSTTKLTTASSLEECLDICSKEPTCKSAIYHLIDDSQCALLSGTGESTADSEKCPNHHYAYEIDPPTQPAKDEYLVACSTSCPTGTCSPRYSRQRRR